MERTFDHVTKTLPGPADRQNVNIIVNTLTKDKSKVFTKLVNIANVKEAIGHIIRLGNPFYAGLTISNDNTDLERVFVPTQEG